MTTATDEQKQTFYDFTKMPTDSPSSECGTELLQKKVRSLVVYDYHSGAYVLLPQTNTCTPIYVL